MLYCHLKLANVSRITPSGCRKIFLEMRTWTETSTRKRTDHHLAMHWQGCPRFFPQLETRLKIVHLQTLSVKCADTRHDGSDTSRCKSQTPQSKTGFKKRHFFPRMCENGEVATWTVTHRRLPCLAMHFVSSDHFLSQHKWMRETCVW